MRWEDSTRALLLSVLDVRLSRARRSAAEPTSPEHDRLAPLLPTCPEAYNPPVLGLRACDRFDPGPTVTAGA
jgi:hypothetical protein